MNDNRVSIDHEYTDNIVCPHCGEVYSDCHEFPSFGVEVCCECGGRFEFTCDVTVTYSTLKLGEPDG